MDLCRRVRSKSDLYIMCSMVLYLYHPSVQSSLTDEMLHKFNPLSAGTKLTYFCRQSRSGSDLKENAVRSLIYTYLYLTVK